MNTTLSEQIKAIQEVREIISSSSCFIVGKPKGYAKDLDSRLNDAGSTIAALNLSPQPEQSGNTLGNNRDEYRQTLIELFGQLSILREIKVLKPEDFETLTQQEVKLIAKIDSVTIDRVNELEARIEELETLNSKRVIEGAKQDPLI